MKAIVLCAGNGTRMGWQTKELPKPMLDLNGSPILEFTINNLVFNGFGDIAVNLHHFGETISGYFGDGSKWNAKISYYSESSLLGTAGALKNMENFLCDEELFLVQYGDVLTNQNFSKMIEFHKNRQAIVTIMVHQREQSNSKVDIDDNGMIIGFLERPSKKNRSDIKSHWVNSGICLCNNSILNLIQKNDYSDLPCDVFPQLMKMKKLYAYPLSGYRCSIDTPARLDEVRHAVASGLIKLRSME